MDVAQVTELRTWAARLEERGSSEELRAAGKAIHMLVEEVESLQAKLVEAKAGAPLPVTAPPPEQKPWPEETPTSEAEAEATEPPWSAADDRYKGSFFSRVKKSLGFD